MSSEQTALTAEFPLAMRGYAREAVDEFIQQIGQRLANLQSEVNKQTARGDRLSKDLGSQAEELATFREKERALTSVLLSLEERKVQADSELKSVRATAQGEADAMLAEARKQAEAMTLEAAALKTQSEAVLANARAEVEALKNQVRAEGEAVKNQARAEADAIRGQARMEGEGIKLQARAELEQLKAAARAEADAILAKAYVQSEEMTQRNQAVLADLEFRLRTLRTEYHETMTFVRQALEAQLATLPAHDEALGSPNGYHAVEPAYAGRPYIESAA